MKDKEELKKAVIESCINGTMTIKVAADRLSFSERYVKKLKARYKKYGASSMMILKVKYGKFGIFQNLKNVILLIFKKF